MVTASPATFFIIPMAISLAYGVLFATAITLFLVPCLYLILNDLVGFGEPNQDPEYDAYQAELKVSKNTA